MINEILIRIGALVFLLILNLMIVYLHYLHPEDVVNHAQRTLTGKLMPVARNRKRIIKKLRKNGLIALLTTPIWVIGIIYYVIQAINLLRVQ